MRLEDFKLIVVLGIAAVVLSACSSTASTTVTSPTRAATQTPWIIYVPVTVTPEPATITPLPTAEVKTTPSRTATRAPVAVKPAATATKPAVVAALPPPTAAPTCNLGSVSPFFPENGVRREINIEGTSGPAFEFKWTTPLGSGTQDSTIGYRIEITSKRGNQTVGGDVVYVSHNAFIEKGMYSYEGAKVRRLGAGDSASITWYVTIIKASGGFSNQGTVSGAEIKCGTPSQLMSIELYFR